MAKSYIPETIVDIDLNDVDTFDKLQTESETLELYEQIGLDWFKLDGDSVYSADHLLKWINVCDRTNRLTSRFCFRPVTNEYGQGFTATTATISRLHIPRRKADGSMQFSRQEDGALVPIMDEVRNVVLPPYDPSQGAEGVQWFSHFNPASRPISAEPYMSERGVSARNSFHRSVNPTTCFRTKLALRQLNEHTFGFPVVEFVYIPISASDHSAAIDVWMAVEYDWNTKLLMFKSESYDTIRSKMIEAKKQSWNISSADAIRLDMNLEQLTKNVNDPAKRAEMIRKANDYVERMVKTNNMTDEPENDGEEAEQTANPNPSIVREPVNTTSKSKNKKVLPN